jgi:hypothetical protein
MLEAWAVWLVLTAAVVALELVAVFSKRRGDTISESVWWLLRRGFGVALLPLYVWLGWHFFLEFWGFPRLRATFADDVAIVAAVAVLTAVGQLRLRRRK